MIAVPFYNDILIKCGWNEKIIVEKQKLQHREIIEGKTSDTTLHLARVQKQTLPNMFYSHWSNILVKY